MSTLVFVMPVIQIKAMNTVILNLRSSSEDSMIFMT